MAKKKAGLLQKMFPWFFVAMVMMCGCQRDEVSVYSVPVAFRDKVHADAPVAEGAEVSSEISWKAPQGWDVLPAQTMRLAGFRHGGVELTVTAFPGSVGSLTDNVNRWLGQVGLAPVDEAGAKAMVRERSIHGQTLQRLSIVGKTQLEVAMVSYADKMWFFKLSGPPEEVRGALPEFEQFLVGVEFADAH